MAHRVCLYVVAGLQLFVAGLNLCLPRLLKWRPDLERMPLLIRQVFYVHAWFISITLVIFAALTIRFAHALSDGSNPMGRWLAVAIAMFWGFRAILQVSYYSSGHWRGHRGRTTAHVALLGTYGGFAVVYALAAF